MPALMSAGNLEGSWYYMLLNNEQIVKRTKATSLPMPDEVISYINGLSEKRNINKSNNASQPIFEQNKRVIVDDGLDHDDENIYNKNMRRFSHAVTPNTDEMYDDSYVDEMNVQHDAPVPYTMNDINNIDNIPDVSDMNDMSDMNNQDDYDYTQLETDDVNIETVEYDDSLTEYYTPNVDDVHNEHEVLQLSDVTDDTYAVDHVLTDALSCKWPPATNLDLSLSKLPSAVYLSFKNMLLVMMLLL